MKLSGAEDSTIRLMGRCKSDSFLKYIRKQMLQFSSNISQRMLDHEHFTHIPNFNEKDTSSSMERVESPPKKKSNKNKPRNGKGQLKNDRDRSKLKCILSKGWKVN